MKNGTFTYISLIFLHVIIAFAVYFLPFLSKIYALIIPVLGFFIVYKNKNRNNEVLYVSAYLVGAEVLLRMTGGNFNNEYVKLLIIFFMLCGMLYNNFSKSGLIYLIFLMLLLPGIFVTTNNSTIDIDVKKILVFNLSGPICLAISAIYMYQRRVSLKDLQNILCLMGLPIISIAVYLFLYNPNVRDVITGTQSNFETSGGFGPNQVSTILGLGIFIFFSQLILFSRSKKEIIINAFLLIIVTYRGIVTFSRGGIFTAVAMIICLLFLSYKKSNPKGKSKFVPVFVVTGLIAVGVWTYSSFQTYGLIGKRYANQDARGRVKADLLGGREEIMSEELAIFLDNPVLGIGAGMGKEVRKEAFGYEAASHNEVTRMLSEHGLFGIFGLLLLVITPFGLYINNNQHLYFISFFAFWALTINHAAMRTAAPAFIYALCLLHVQIKIPEEKEI
ncbi:O-antigen ligase family protein [Flavobacterium olei]|uniref:O-antigen ligase family protein n=1 Tax=Flavobacterium olei TaxID=1886782 RepID=UPI00321A726F